MIVPKSESEIKRMRKAGRIVAEFFEKVEKLIRPGVSLDKISELAWEITTKRGGYPSFYKYQNYPAPVCVSINEEVIHGIPRRDRVIAEGDVVSVDFGVMYDGFHADAAKTFIAGHAKDEIAEKLVKVTQNVLYEAIRYLRPEMKTGDLGSFIENYVRSNGFSVVREFCGHGIGRNLHEDPPILNYGTPDRGVKLVENLTICIEPMVSAGSGEVVILGDGWTVVTKDRSLAAHFEHTIRIKDGENEILTL